MDMYSTLLAEGWQHLLRGDLGNAAEMAEQLQPTAEEARLIALAGACVCRQRVRHTVLWPPQVDWAGVT